MILRTEYNFIVQHNVSIYFFIKHFTLIIYIYFFQPGRKDDLFLKSMLVDAGNSTKAKKINDVILKKPSKSTIQRKAFTGKRKALSLSDRRIIERERESAVLAYRQLKQNAMNKFD